MLLSDSQTTEVRDPALTLSAEQRLWWKLYRDFQGHECVCHCSIRVRLTGALDRRALRTALTTLLDEHPRLKALISVSDEQPTFSNPPTAGGELMEHSLNQESASTIFNGPDPRNLLDVLEGHAFRAELFCVSDLHHVLRLTIHRLVSDRFSLGSLFHDLSVLYIRYPDKGPPGDSTHRLPSAVSLYSRDSAASGDMADTATATPRSTAPPLELPLDWPRTTTTRYHNRFLPLSLGASLSRRLATLAQDSQISCETLLLAAWGLLLIKLSSQQEIEIGTLLDTRLLSTASSRVGMFESIATVTLAARPQSTFSDFLRAAESQLSMRHPCSIASMSDADSARPISAKDWFEHHCRVMFMFRDTDALEPAFASIQVSLNEDAIGYVPCELCLSLIHRGDEITGSILYRPDLFNLQSVQRWRNAFLLLLQGLADDQLHRPITEVSLLSPEERHQLIYSFNNTAAWYPESQTLHAAFEEQVRRSPGAIALVEDSVSYTYADINSRANRLARLLQRNGVQIGGLVLILAKRSAALVVCQLGILKCGAAYVPIDPAIPAERRSYISRDSGARCGVRAVDIPEEISDTTVHWMNYHEVSVSMELDSDLGLPVTADFPAYLMYTSGSTGLPKGVIVQHRGVSRVAINGGYANISSTDTIVHCSNPAFDASTFEVWSALLNGARVLVVPQSVLMDRVQFRTLLMSSHATVMLLTTAFFNQLANADPGCFATLRYLLVGGEAADIGTFKLPAKAGFTGHFHNVYGPTETTVFATYYPTSSLPADARSVPIGQPISNTAVYIADKTLNLRSIGLIGEIYIGGPGTAIGYLNRPDLTAERFIADPFGSRPGSRIYKTGDLGRWLPDGAIEYCGRNDQQIKLRGFRIELGEIEARILEHPLVKECAVLVRSSATSDKILVAYLVGRAAGSEGDLNVTSLRQFLQSRLPEYMIPSAWMSLPQLPLTPNGKLDRRALPQPDNEHFVTEPYVAPQGLVEQILSEIWTDVIGIPRVGSHDNFFVLGGTSLRGMALAERVSERLGVQLPAISVFQYPTVHQMADHIKVLSLTGLPSTTSDLRQLEEGYV